MMKDIDIALQNINSLGRKDIILASYLGSGSSLLGGILIELGLDYIEGYQEKVLKGEKNTEVVLPLWRKHWKQLDEKYLTCDKTGPRFFKTHFYPISFKDAAPKRAVLLIRDARDAVISYYNWRKGFSDEKGTLEGFLKRKGFYGKKPFDDWNSYISKWLLWGKQNDLYIIKYEDLKFNGFLAIKELLCHFNIKRTKREILSALANSRFSKIQKEEKKVSPSPNQPKIFRRGLVGEWRSVLRKEEMSALKNDVKITLRKYGYIDSSAKFVDVDYWIIGFDSTAKWLLNQIPKTKKVAIIIPANFPHCSAISWLTKSRKGLILVNDNFSAKYLDLISGNVYLGIDDEDVGRSLAHLCCVNNKKFLVRNSTKEECHSFLND